jgi:acetylornithine deacetylase/succinyl-diaminopimelate desuccinylase-like protein
VFWGFNHFLVAEGFDKEHAYLSDPAQGRVRVEMEEFLDNFTGVVIEFEPGPSFQCGGNDRSPLLSLPGTLLPYAGSLGQLLVVATAEAVIDCRVIPGRQAAFEREIDELIGPDVSREWISELGSYETGFDGDLVDAMNAAVLAHDPDARIVPYILSGGTDAKAFAGLGIRCFGFAPLRLPPELDFAALFHGVDERVPVDALQFGAQVLEHFLKNC